MPRCTRERRKALASPRRWRCRPFGDVLLEVGRDARRRAFRRQRQRRAEELHALAAVALRGAVGIVVQLFCVATRQRPLPTGPATSQVVFVLLSQSQVRSQVVPVQSESSRHTAPSPPQRRTTSMKTDAPSTMLALWPAPFQPASRSEPAAAMNSPTLHLFLPRRRWAVAVQQAGRADRGVETRERVCRIRVAGACVESQMQTGSHVLVPTAARRMKRQSVAVG